MQLFSFPNNVRTQKVSDDVWSSNRRLVNGILRSGSYGDLPKLLADVVKSGNEGRTSVYDFLVQLNEKSPLRAESFWEDMKPYLPDNSRRVPGLFKSSVSESFGDDAARSSGSSSVGGTVHVRSYEQTRGGNTVYVSAYDRTAPGGGGGNGAQNSSSEHVQPPLPKPDFQSAEQRKKAILGVGDADFRVEPSPNANTDAPWYTLSYFSEVKENEKTIESESKRAGLEPDFVKAIIYLETTQGYYDRFFEFGDVAKSFDPVSMLPPDLPIRTLPYEVLNMNDSVRPMNIKSNYWRELGYSRRDFENPKKNIQAGVELLKRIKQKMPGASAAEIATIYNGLGQTKVSDYGARVERLMREKPWERKK